MLAVTFLSSLSLLASTALAAPSKTSGCDISKAKLSVPSGQTALAVPSEGPSFIAFAVGTQNYTCSSASTYTNVGAVAELFDISCLYGTKSYNSIGDTAYALWKAAPSWITAPEIVSALSGFKSPVILGQHYYVTSPSGTGVSPKWDFTSAKYRGDADAFVLAAKVAGIPAPQTKTDVDWVSLKQVQGDLATQVFRVDTKGGQPPASCKPGSADIQVKYIAKYWLYGSTVGSAPTCK